MLLAQGNLPAARQAADEAVASGALSAVERARLLAWASQLPMYAGDFDASQQAAEDAQRAGEEAGDAPAVVQATVAQAHVASMTGRLTEAASLAARSVSVADADGSLDAMRPVPHLVAALVAVDRDDIAGAADLVARGRRAAEVAGDQSGLLFAHLVGSYGPFFSGAWDDAVAELEAAASLAAETETQGSRLAGLCELALIALWREGPDAAERWVNEALASPALYEYHAAWLGWALAACQLGRGQPEAALATLTQAWDACRGAGLSFEYRILGPPLAARAARSDRRLAGEVADELAVLAAANPAVASLQGAALRARGLADHDPDVLLDALAAYRRSPRVPEWAATAADAALALALALAGTGNHSQARPVALESLRLWAQMGATWQGTRTRAELRAAGLRLGARDPHRVATTGWEALTSTEVRVVELVGQRMSNPQIAARLFVSRRTVESHVSHALAKLGVAGRLGLADAVADRARVVEDRARAEQ
ncbi:MAG: helix-turn-helix transcriptional regulator [Acidimicrobiales bacterium]